MAHNAPDHIAETEIAQGAAAGFQLAATAYLMARRQGVRGQQSRPQREKEATKEPESLRPTETEPTASSAPVAAGAQRGPGPARRRPRPAAERPADPDPYNADGGAERNWGHGLLWMACG